MYLLDAEYVVGTKTKQSVNIVKQSVYGYKKIIFSLRAIFLEKYFIGTENVFSVYLQ